MLAQRLGGEHPCELHAGFTHRRRGRRCRGGHGRAPHSLGQDLRSAGASCGGPRRRRHLYALISSETRPHAETAGATRRNSLILRFARRNVQGACHRTENGLNQTPDHGRPSMSPSASFHAFPATCLSLQHTWHCAMDFGTMTLPSCASLDRAKQIVTI